MPSPTLDRMDCPSAKRISTMKGEFEGGKHLYKGSKWEISGRCHELSLYNECREGEENLCVHVTRMLFVQKHLFVWEVVSLQRGFLEDYFACMMAAFGGAGSCNVPGGASIKAFLEGMVCVDPPRMLYGWIRRGS